MIEKTKCFECGQIIDKPVHRNNRGKWVHIQCDSDVKDAW